jgi:phage gp37-like protein
MVAAIVTAMIEAILSGLAGARTVDRYAGQLEPDEAGNLVFVDPAVFVVYNGSTRTRIDNRSFSEAVRFSTLVACRNLATQAAAEADALTMSAALVDLLTNSRLGIADIDPLTPGPTELVFVLGDLCVYGTSWETTFIYTPTIAPA